MNFIQNLQRAIDYMEDHILESITYEDVAKHVYMSSYHFHRTFSLVTRFHGITSNVARRAGMKLKSFNRLLIKIKLEGGTVMDYRIEKREEFKLLAKVSKFRNESISEEGNTEIPDFWKECGKNGTFDVLKQNTSKHDIYGACAPISKESTHFDYGIGMEFSGGNVPERYTIWEVKPTLWAVFKCIGETCECIGETWGKIFSEFLPSSEYSMIDDTDFELYSENIKADCFCEIWIPVEKKINV